MAKCNNYLITKEATKYWKKAIKSDRVMISNYSGSVYIVNGYNAFKFPAVPWLWDELARPAFMSDMPTENEAVEYRNGERNPTVAADVAKILERNTENNTTAAERTPFTMDSKNATLRIFKNNCGDVATVNSIYDSMVDFSHAKKIYCNNSFSPVCTSNELGFVALLLPVRRPADMPHIVADAFAAIMEE